MHDYYMHMPILPWPIQAYYACDLWQDERTNCLDPAAVLREYAHNFSWFRVSPDDLARMERIRAENEALLHALPPVGRMPAAIAICHACFGSGKLVLFSPHPEARVRGGGSGGVGSGGDDGGDWGCLILQAVSFASPPALPPPPPSSTSSSSPSSSLYCTNNDIATIYSSCVDSNSSSSTEVDNAIATELSEGGDSECGEGRDKSSHYCDHVLLALAQCHAAATAGTTGATTTTVTPLKSCGNLASDRCMMKELWSSSDHFHHHLDDATVTPTTAALTETGKNRHDFLCLTHFEMGQFTYCQKVDCFSNIRGVFACLSDGCGASLCGATTHMREHFDSTYTVTSSCNSSTSSCPPSRHNVCGYFGVTKGHHNDENSETGRRKMEFIWCHVCQQSFSSSSQTK